ncbi:MAG: GcrA cell cycle regulator, partial [Pseudomonadota bacterium]|nr:GcrA cell cycle regulator [Pseudomonadota bacterium]
MAWTDERIERLKTMWTDGATASQIADDLGGVSRNAVIGKAHRLGLEQRPSPVKAGEDKEKKAAAAAAAEPKPAARPDPEPDPEPAPEAKAAAETVASTLIPVRPGAPRSDNIQYRSVGPGGFIRQGPGDTQAPIPPAPP